MLTNSVVAMAFDQQTIKTAQALVLQNLSSDAALDLSAFEQHFNTPMANMDPKKYVGLVLIDGLSGKEEQIIDRIGDATNVNFIGGSAGDDLKFAATHVFANGICYSNAAVLVLIEPADRFTFCLLYTSPSPRDRTRSRMPSSA